MRISKLEKTVIQLVFDEYSSKEISEVIDRSKRTVDGIKLELYKKIKVKNVAGLLKWSIENQIIKLQGVSSEWIDIRQKKPTDGKAVLCKTESVDEGCRVGTRINDKIFALDRHFSELTDVRFWMELPKKRQ